MRRALLTATLLLGVAPNAVAAPFGELPFRSAGGTATCLRATGSPGEVVRSTKTGAQFLQTTPAGLVPVADVAFEGQTLECPEAASQPNGAGLVAFAGTLLNAADGGVQVSLREPGGAWGPVAKVASVPDLASGHPLSASVSERGDALVAFAGRGARGSDVRAVRRAPGGAFTPAETIFSTGKDAGSTLRVAAGVSAAGESVVAWSFKPKAGKPREVWYAIAPFGAPFGTPAKVGALKRGAPFTLAVGAGGHALLAFTSGDDVLVADRAPGAAFAAPVRVGAASDPILTMPAAAVRADGAAAVTWLQTLDGDVEGVTRTQPGPFGAPVSLAPKSGLKFPKGYLDAVLSLYGDDDEGELTSSTASPDDDGGAPRAAITPDGRVLVTWPGAAKRDGLWWSAPTVAMIPLAGGAAQTRTFGSELRESGSMAPVVQADGTAGVVWADNDERERDGRLHLALEGVADSADPAAPELQVIAPERRVLRADEDLRFRVRCSAACDVRVQLGTGILAAGETTSLAKAGEKEIRLAQVSQPLASLRGGSVDIQVRYAAPGARVATTKTVTFKLRRLPDAPRPRVLDAVARRVGEDVVVTWRSDRDAKASNFFGYATERRNPRNFDDFYGDGDTTGSGRRFSLRLKNAAKARYVHISATVKGARKIDTTVVRIRG